MLLLLASLEMFFPHTLGEYIMQFEAMKDWRLWNLMYYSFGCGLMGYMS